MAFKKPPILASLARLPGLASRYRQSRPRSPTTLALRVALSASLAMLLFYLVLGLQSLVSALPDVFPGHYYGFNHYYGFSSAYSFDAQTADNPDWMGHVPDMIPVSWLSLPGTHDTMTYAIPDMSLKCQNVKLERQLHAGIRYVDMRARLKDDRLDIYHADAPTGFSLTAALTILFDFLENHSREFLVMRLKEEGKPIGHNTVDFETAFDRMRLQDPTFKSRTDKHLYVYNDTMPLPTLGEVRSKIMLLQDFHSPRSVQYGPEWDGHRMVLEDKWIVDDVAHLPEKWAAIEAALERVNSDPHVPNKKLYLTHLSASVGVLPIEAAAGPRNGSMIGMNDKTGLWVDRYWYDSLSMRVGIVIMDFPGRRIIDRIIKWNELLWILLS
ncbi:hypothetical protein ED733_005304 [Metarhizium rileyi]|uniref:Phosphatidylinositol-specific phospholipase C X domain-containing protein n=1 Tax=Metarhizium rileyi (strain RCEF 4871) TaxID=1649241 RepID=A0A5C6GHT2_METRR|nr:hypothetical protein ED733_005304 [Metarhizium rileyi]